MIIARRSARDAYGGERFNLWRFGRSSTYVLRRKVRTGMVAWCGTRRGDVLDVQVCGVTFILYRSFTEVHR